MLDFSTWLDLPLIWASLIACAIFLYVMLDGFDLGVGILFPFAPSNVCRDRMINSIAPFWDGNETWLVMGGGGLFAAFPLAYSILMPAFYMPIIFMLLGLVFRGVAFEFRFKSDASGQRCWDMAFHFGSLLAAFMQGVILGNVVLGIEAVGRSFAGGALDWANGFSILTGVAVVFSYILIGSTWLVMKTDDKTQQWARNAAFYSSLFVALFFVLVSIATPLVDERIAKLWFSLPNFLYLLPVPFLTIACFGLLWYDLMNGNEVRPFVTTILVFLLGFVGLAVSLWPWIVPYKFTLWQAAASATSQSLLLVGMIIFLPLVLGYTALSYYIFRGKSSKESLY